jgi:RHS repeat-associated protein
MILRTTRGFDALGRLLGITNFNAQGQAINQSVYGFNPAGQRSAVTNVDGSYWQFAYDDLGQLTNGVRKWSDGTTVAGQQFAYFFDTIGNRLTSIRDTRQAKYTNNLLNQLVGRSVPGYLNIMGDSPSNATVTVNYQSTQRKGDYYRKELSFNNSTGAVWLPVTNLSAMSVGTTSYIHGVTGNVFVAKNPEAFAHDADGNLTNDGRFNYTWDGENRLTTVETVAGVYSVGAPRLKVFMGYDWQNRRISKTVSNATTMTSYPWWTTWALGNDFRFLYNGWNLAAILNSQSSTVLVSFVWGNDLSGTLQGAGGVGGLLATTIHTGTNAGTYYPTYDGNGNVRQYVRASDGFVVAEYEYGPFGEMIRASGAMAREFNFLFSTKYYDWETGLYYYIHRYYEPLLGRWLSRDPIGERGFQMLAGNRNRRDGNLYYFVGNNPITKSDLLGLTTVTSSDWFPGARDVNDNFDFTMNVNDGQDGTVELHRITMAEVEAEMRDLVNQLNGKKKRDGCKSRRGEGGFDSKYFAGENQQHQYYLVDGQGPLYADNQINYIGIGLYEAWLCDSLTKAKAIVWSWKLGKWHDVPSAGTMHWLEVGYNKYQTLKSADDSCCRCPGDDLNTLRSLR